MGDKCIYAVISGGDSVPYGMGGVRLPEYIECDNAMIPDEEYDNCLENCGEQCPYYDTISRIDEK